MDEQEWTEEELAEFDRVETDRLQANVELAQMLVKIRETDEWKLIIDKMWDEDFVNTTVSNYRSFKQDRRFVAEEGLMARSIFRSAMDDIIETGNESMRTLRSNQDED